MKIIIVQHYEEMSQMAAEFIKRQIKIKPDSVLGLAAGNTPLAMYHRLVRESQNNKIDFSRTTLFNLDEYCGLAQSNPNSYYYYMNHHLYQHINVKRENTYIPDGMAKDIGEECRRYDAQIDRKGGIDLQILGIGGNGHIGFNEPGTDFEATTHLVELDKHTIEANSALFPNAQAIPHTAITMGMKTILQSKALILLASGKSKADAIFKTVKGDITPDVPASIVQKHGNATLIIDQEAAAQL